MKEEVRRCEGKREGGTEVFEPHAFCIWVLTDKGGEREFNEARTCKVIDSSEVRMDRIVGEIRGGVLRVLGDH